MRVFRCKVGRVSPGEWIDFDFFGHQLSVHLKPDECAIARTNAVDGDAVPVRHFGIVLPWATWHETAARLAQDGVPFLIEPHVRFAGQPGEQATLFVVDPSGNAIEIKSFQDPGALFRSS